MMTAGHHRHVASASRAILALFVVWLAFFSATSAAYAAPSKAKGAKQDIIPNAFSFISQTGVPTNTITTSNSIIVSGIGSASPISITGGTYSINGGPYTSAAGTVINGQTVTVRQTSSPLNLTTTTATLTIGGVSGAFSVTTAAAATTTQTTSTATTQAVSITVVDTTPDPFSFASQINVPLSTFIYSNSITVTGIDSPAPISIAGGYYSIDGGPYTNAAGTVNLGQTVTVRVLSNSLFATITTATLTIGGVIGSFSVTTVSQDSTPNLFSFTPQTDVPLSTVVTSNPITVSSINVAVVISVTGGTYNIDGGAYTAAAGMITNGQVVTVRVTSSSSNLTTATATLSIGGVSAPFSVTTVAANNSRPTAQNTIVGSKHDLAGLNKRQSVINSGGGTPMEGTAYNDYKDTCVYCHVPHLDSTNGFTFNRVMPQDNYNIYRSPTGTMNSTPNRPSEMSLVCLSCHDGTIAVDSILNTPSTGWTPASNHQTMSAGSSMQDCGSCHRRNGIGHDASASFMTQDLRDDHPVSMSYIEARLRSPKDFRDPIAIAPLTLYNDRVECASCHDVHNPQYAPFLRTPNNASDLCLVCHVK